MLLILVRSAWVLTILNTLSVLTAIFPGEPGLASFIETKDDESDGDSWSFK